MVSEIQNRSSHFDRTALYNNNKYQPVLTAPLPALAAPSEIGFKHNFPAVTADFDSGCCCLGSDRSCGTTKSSCSHYQAAGTSSGGGHRGKAVHYNQRDQLRLSNVEEEARYEFTSLLINCNVKASLIFQNPFFSEPITRNHLEKSILRQLPVLPLPYPQTICQRRNQHQQQGALHSTDLLPENVISEWLQLCSNL